MTRLSRHSRAVRVMQTALAAAALACASSAATAATDNRPAIDRALAHIQAFPGRTLHAEGHSYVARDVVVDADGAEHVRFDRLYRGLPVIGGDLVVHSNRSGAFLDASRELQQAIRVDIAARIGVAEALRAARQAHPDHEADGAPRLVIYARGEQPQLAYDVPLSGEQADETPSELHVIVDATSGTVLENWNDIHTAPVAGSGKSLFVGTVPLTTELSGSTYTLKDTTRGGMSTIDMKNRANGGVAITDDNNIWGSGDTSDRVTVAVDAEYGVALTWDYYKQVHGRNGIANDGRGAQSRVHYKRNYANAFWSDGCFCMTFGDGNASIKPLVSIDVAGHEMSHGVTSRTANLTYSGESGGLNEGTSDIMGTNVEFFAANAADPGDYLIGEKLFANGTSVIRNMMRPSVDGKSADCWYSGVGSLDVHYSSGVANHFYFLLAQGTTGGQPSPTCAAGNTRVATGTGTLAGIGRTKAEKVWYRALTVYMTSSTSYAGARAATLSAAGDLYGAGSPEVNAVAAAWTAVGRN